MAPNDTEQSVCVCVRECGDILSVQKGVGVRRRRQSTANTQSHTHVRTEPLRVDVGAASATASTSSDRRPTGWRRADAHVLFAY